MKKCVVVAGILWGILLGGSSFAAFPTDEIQILEQKDITVLSDDKLIDAYIDVMVEMEASKAFHATSGFKPKEYVRYKELLKYRMLLRFEIYRRKLELPPEAN
ncbi:MAG: hypothetical protein HQL21_03510 [Candidatus Omnitrophica bacterium]|nr:hypothetical protein [Candidatus Omnitrophota bacterium]